MPTYEYEREDGTRFEIEQRITEDALRVCPTTGQKVKRLVSAAAFHLKGSGWYKTDYGSSGSPSSATDTKPSDSSEASKPKESTKSETKQDNKDNSSSTGSSSAAGATSD